MNAKKKWNRVLKKEEGFNDDGRKRSYGAGGDIFLIEIENEVCVSVCVCYLFLSKKKSKEEE